MIENFLKTGGIQNSSFQLVSNEFVSRENVPNYIGPRNILLQQYQEALERGKEYKKDRKRRKKKHPKVQYDKFWNFTNKARKAMGLKPKPSEYPVPDKDRGVAPVKTRMKIDIDPKKALENYINPPLVDPRKAHRGSNQAQLPF